MKRLRMCLKAMFQMVLCVIIIIVIVSCSSFAAAATDKVVCYYGSWSVYRTGNGKFEVEDINPNLCTHIIYAFVGINSDGSVRIMDTWNEIDLQALKRFNDLKATNPSLKTLMAVGGWNEGSIVFSEVANSATLRASFIASATNLIQTYGYDGFDLDWEYPAQRGGGSYDKENFITLLKEFRAEFDLHGYLLSAAVAAGASSVDTSYDVPNVARYLDFVNVMTYDLHGSWDGVTGQNGPLYASSLDVTDAQKSLNVNACIRGWISRGAPKEKLNLGMGTYGRTFTLADATDHGLGAAATSGGTQGPYTQETGMLGYIEICEKLQAGGWTVVWDEEQEVPYGYSGNQWIGYDNPESIALKVEFAKKLGLGGTMIWSIETDDFKGICGTAYPILKAINAGLRLNGTNSSTPKTSTRTTITTITTPTSSSSASETLCSAEGYVRDLDDCSKFYYCRQSGSSFTQLAFQCGSRLLFDTTLNVCNYASAVQC